MDFSALLVLITSVISSGIVFLKTWGLLWIPLLLIFTFWILWVQYVRTQFLASLEFTLLEIRLPRELMKSPLAMEVVLKALHQTGGEGNWYDKFWKGGVRAWFSLEIVSIGGSIHFFIWTQKKHRKTIETQIYGQFPEVEVHEVPDYALTVLHEGDKAVSLWGCEFTLTKADSYPIKTYIDYGLDRDPKEEFKIDPLTAVIEFLGAIGPKEQAWYQIIIRAHKEEAIKNGTIIANLLAGGYDIIGEKGIFGKKGPIFGRVDSWKDSAKEEIQKIVKEATFKTEDQKNPGHINTSKGQQELVAALERSISKFGFDVGIRALYLADKDSFNPDNIGGLTGSFRQYSTLNLNGFKPTNTTSVDFPWQDWFGKVARLKREIFDDYRRRSYFWPPYTHRKYRKKPFVLNTEELATIFHFPGDVAKTPTFERIETKKVEPPSSLPV